MDNTLKYVLLGGIALAGGYYFLSGSKSSVPPSPTGYSGSTPVPPGGTYGSTGITNDTGDWNWLTATGNLVNSLGSAFANIYPEVTSGSTTAPAARGQQMTLTQYLKQQNAPALAAADDNNMFSF